MHTRSSVPERYKEDAVALEKRESRFGWIGCFQIFTFAHDEEALTSVSKEFWSRGFRFLQFSGDHAPRPNPGTLCRSWNMRNDSRTRSIRWPGFEDRWVINLCCFAIQTGYICLWSIEGWEWEIPRIAQEDCQTKDDVKNRLFLTTNEDAAHGRSYATMYLPNTMLSSEPAFSLVHSSLQGLNVVKGNQKTTMLLIFHNGDIRFVLVSMDSLDKNSLRRCSICSPVRRTNGEVRRLLLSKRKIGVEPHAMTRASRTTTISASSDFLSTITS